MLILSRKERESIVINHDIEITVVEIKDGRVRLGISAPKDMDIHRKEVYDMIVEETRQAAGGTGRLDDLKKLGLPTKIKK